MKIQRWLSIAFSLGLIAVIATFYVRNDGLHDQVSKLREEVVAADKAQEQVIAPFPGTLSLLGGETLKISEPNQSGTFVLVFSPSCPECVRRGTEWGNLGLAIGTGEKVIAVSTGEEAATKDFAARYQFRFPVALDRDKAFQKHFGIVHTPSYLLLDSNGYLQLRDPLWPVVDKKRARLNVEIFGEEGIVGVSKPFLPSTQKATAFSFDGVTKGTWVLEGQAGLSGFAFHIARPINSGSCTDLQLFAFFDPSGNLVGLQPLQPHEEYSAKTANFKIVDFLELGKRFADHTQPQLSAENLSNYFPETPKLGHAFLTEMSAIHKLFQSSNQYSASK